MWRGESWSPAPVPLIWPPAWFTPEGLMSVLPADAFWTDSKSGCRSPEVLMSCKNSLSAWFLSGMKREWNGKVFRSGNCGTTYLLWVFEVRQRLHAMLTASTRLVSHVPVSLNSPWLWGCKWLSRDPQIVEDLKLKVRLRKTSHFTRGDSVVRNIFIIIL